jgi:hypothetical protein
MTTEKPLPESEPSLPRRPSGLRLLLAGAGTCLLMAVAVSVAGQAGVSSSKAGHGRVLAAPAPIHAAVTPGRLLAPRPVFAPVQMRGSRPAVVSPHAAREPSSQRRPAGIVLM